MENPVREIAPIIRLLTQSPPSVQRATIERYFTPDASFTHPFCRTGSSPYSRWLIECIYRWYKIMSPRIELEVDSVAHDEAANVLYVSMHQLFRIWFVPFHSAPVRLVTVLHLTRDRHSSYSIESMSSGRKRQNLYYIKSQNDLYQVNEFVKFFSVFRIVWMGLLVWQFAATVLCVFGTLICLPVTWAEGKVVGRDGEIEQVRAKDVVKGIAKETMMSGHEIMRMIGRNADGKDWNG